MKQHKLIKDMSKEERAAYQRDWYNRKVGKAPASQTLNITIHNCPDDLKQAILNAISESN